MTIPVFNHARFIGRAIEGVLAQQFDDFDVLVVDDASVDNTSEVVARYLKDPRVQYIRNERNLGLAGNWNRCLGLARGPLVMVFGSDDILDSDYLISASQIFDAYPQVGMVYAPVRYIDGDGHVINLGVSRPSRLYHAGDEAMLELRTNGGACITTMTVRRECYEELGAFDETIWNGPDLEFAVRVAAHYDIYDLGRVSAAVRVHDAKAGQLGYLNKAILESYIYGSRKTWGHLSQEGLQSLGIEDLDKYVADESALFALNGALTVIAHGRPDLVRYYLRRVIELDPKWLRRGRFWKAAFLAIVPFLGRRLMRARMRMGKGEE